MGYLIIILYGVFLVYALQYNSSKATKLLVYICFFQNIVLVFMSEYISSGQFTILALAKEAYVMAYIAIRVIKKGRVSNATFFCAFSVVILAIITIFSEYGTVIGRLASFRQLYLPLVFFLYGDNSELSRDEIRDICRTFINCCIISVIFGFIEIALGTDFWISAGLSNYASLKGVTSYMHSSGLMRSFYSYDFGFAIRRMASILVDPVILGQLLGIGFLISAFADNIYNNKRNKYIGTVLIGIGLVCTIAKGGIIIAVVGTCLLLSKLSKKKIVSNLMLVAAVLFCIAFVFFGIENSLSVSVHLYGLISGVKSLLSNPMGYGIGSAGNMAYKGGNYDAVMSEGSESFFGSVMVQIGLLGVIIYSIFYLILMRRKRICHRWDLLEILFVANIGLLLTAFVNNTAISFISCFPYFILYGSVVSSGKD